MTKKPFQEQLSKFSLMGQFAKGETGLEEAWENLKKSVEPFTAQDIIKQQQETINRQQAEIERLKKLLAEADIAYNKCAKRFYKEGVKEFAEKAVIELTANYSDKYCHWIDDTIDNLVKEMVGEG